MSSSAGNGASSVSVCPSVILATSPELSGQPCLGPNLVQSASFLCGFLSGSIHYFHFISLWKKNSPFTVAKSDSFLRRES